MTLRETALAWQAARRPAVVVELLEVRGSVPREAGTRMLVAADAVAGTIGGGHLEWKAVERARALLRGQPQPPTWRVPLGPALGQCCGGSLVLGFVALADSRPAAWPEPAPRFLLQLHGAGHVGRAIARLLETLPCRVQWLDERDDAFPDTPPVPHVQRLASDDAAADVALAPPGSAFVVLTHRHDLDLAIVDAVLRRGDFAFAGMIGSRTKRERFVRRLLERGHAPELVDRLVCPIGVPGIDGKEPEVIAVAVAAQLLQGGCRR